MTETTDTNEATEAPEVEATEVAETVTETEPAACDIEWGKILYWAMNLW